MNLAEWRHWWSMRPRRHKGPPGFSSWGNTVDDPRKPVSAGWLTHDGVNWRVVAMGPGGEMLTPSLPVERLIIHGRTRDQYRAGDRITFTELPRLADRRPWGDPEAFAASVEAMRSTLPTAGWNNRAASVLNRAGSDVRAYGSYNCADTVAPGYVPPSAALRGRRAGSTPMPPDPPSGIWMTTEKR